MRPRRGVANATALSSIEDGAIHLSQRRFALLCILAYVALAWAARFDMRLGEQIASLVYPLDTFSMYGGMPGEDRSHLLVRDAQGEVYRISDFRSYHCLEPLTGSDVRCAGRLGIPYHYEELIHYIETHQGQGELAVELITRTWNFPPGEPVRTADCVVAHCTVAR